MFELEPGLMIWTVITFLLLLVLLSKFAYKPILGLMEQRELGIRHSLEEAQRRREEAEALLADYRKQLEQGRSEAHKIIEESRVIGENVKREILTKASEESKLLVKKAQEEIEREKRQALMALQERVADLSLEIASKVIQSSLKPSDHMKLIEASLTKVKEEYGKG